MPATILIVDDEKNTREGLSLALEDDYEVYIASGAEEAFNLMEAESFDVILTDLRMAGQSGLKVIDRAISLPNRPICIMMTAYGNVETAVEAMRRGAFDFLTKPVSLEKLEILIKRALQSRSYAANIVSPGPRRTGGDRRTICGARELTNQSAETIAAVAKVEAEVCVTQARDIVAFRHSFYSEPVISDLTYFSMKAPYTDLLIYNIIFLSILNIQQESHSHIVRYRPMPAVGS